MEQLLSVLRAAGRNDLAEALSANPSDIRAVYAAGSALAGLAPSTPGLVAAAAEARALRVPFERAEQARHEKESLRRTEADRRIAAHIAQHPGAHRMPRPTQSLRDRAADEDRKHHGPE